MFRCQVQVIIKLAWRLSEQGAAMTILVTGGAGFIGSNFVIDWCDQNEELIINVDKLTYAGNWNNLSSLEGNESHVFVKGDISDYDLLKKLVIWKETFFI